MPDTPSPPEPGTIHARIRQLRMLRSWSMEDLAVAVSVFEGLKKPLAWQTVQQWENGTSSPKMRRVQAVAAVLDVSPSVLLGDQPIPRTLQFGPREGWRNPEVIGASARRKLDAGATFEVLDAGAAMASEAPGSYGLQPILAWQHEDELPQGEYVMIPRLDVHLSAGNGAGSTQVEIQFDQAQPQAFRADWIRQQHLKPKKLAAMLASGDSMEPAIYDRDSLLIDTSQTTVQDGKVYALWYEGGERVKRLYRLPGGGLRIKSDNPQYGTIELGPDYVGHVRIIGRVVHRSGTGGL